MNENWVCAVSVATVWTDPDAPRLVDLPALQQPVQLEKWFGQLMFEDRLALSEENRIQTQLLYGEPVIVEEVMEDWAKIIASGQPSSKDPRGYPGWVPLVQLSQRCASYTRGHVRVTVPKAWLNDETGQRFMQVSFNTVFPVSRRQGDQFRVWTPHGWKLIRTRDVNQIEENESGRPLEKGRKFLGLPYVWGGMSGWGFDCSGIVHQLWKSCGVLLPRDAADQAETGLPISLKQEDWRKGDLLFFRETQDGPVSHVAMYAGGGQIMHAPATGRNVEQIPLAGSAYRQKLCSVRRIQN
ncbi:MULTISPECIES: C40 family peptidase [unclassified Sporosarcina]|uniref:C40 family peptidase n=1 Tax=unclassified Sporosarcina TaxID=2647733 RepID=UPI00203B0E02|nr:MULTISPECIES: C40 family peptidase [unclassified Sporosarcina]